MGTDLTSIFADDPDGREALEKFILSQNLPDHLGTFDGLGQIRQIERSADALRLIGWIWVLDREKHAFLLEIEHQGEENAFPWGLYLDATEALPRRARNIVDLCDRPEDTGWKVTRTGTGRLEDGVFKARRKRPSS